MIALDTNVIIAAVSDWHDHYASSRAALDHLAERSERLVIAPHCLAEAYSVLTRLPTGFRVSPVKAFGLLTNRLREFAIFPKTGVPWGTLERMAAAGVAGGRAHDALLLETVVAGGATTFLTWNVRHFREVAPPGLTVREP